MVFGKPPGNNSEVVISKKAWYKFILSLHVSYYNISNFPSVAYSIDMKIKNRRETFNFKYKPNHSYCEQKKRKC